MSELLLFVVVFEFFIILFGISLSSDSKKDIAKQLSSSFGLNEFHKNRFRHNELNKATKPA